MGNWSSKSKEQSPTPVRSPVIFSPSTRNVSFGTQLNRSSSTSHSFSVSSTYPNTGTSSVGLSAGTLTQIPPTYPNTGTSSVGLSAGTLKQVPPTLVIGNQTVKHSVNDYKVPKVLETANVPAICVNIPHRKSVDKFILRVCSHYNSRSGCHAVICRRFHVCFFWVQEKCRKDVCEYDHSFGACHNQSIIGTLTNIRNFSTDMLSEVLKNNHKYNRKTKRNVDTSICMFSIMRKCTQDPCSLEHSNKPYLWEVKNKFKWLKLAHEQSSVLEQYFSQPDQEIVELPTVPDIKALQRLRSLLTPNSKWKIDFQSMEVYCDSIRYEIRRLSTPSDICCLYSMNKFATRWVWYWQDDSDLWTPYTDGCGSKFYLICLSDQLEFHYNFSDDSVFEVTLGSYLYKIDVLKMTQLNVQTGKIRNVRRRPSYVNARVEDIYFDQFFCPPAGQGNIRQSIPNGSLEFTFIKGLMEDSMGTVTLLSVQRIVNHDLWKAYQNKKDQLKAFYQCDLSLVNEQYMFHGTKHSVIDQICKENFDWRLYGTNVGNVYGHGVYFSNLASLSNSYSETDSSCVKVMFVVLVLAGYMAIGDRTMKFPPKNEKTQRCFDTTCDDAHNSRIFVKYNRDEYYPAYIACYRS